MPDLPDLCLAVATPWAGAWDVFIVDADGQFLGTTQARSSDAVLCAVRQWLEERFGHRAATVRVRLGGSLAGSLQQTVLSPATCRARPGRRRPVARR